MKALSLTVAMAMLACAVHARLGETPGEVVERYGTPTKTVQAGSGPFVGLTNQWAGLFRYRSYTITVVFVDGKSAAEFVTPVPHERLEKSDADSLVKLIGGSEGWTEKSETGVDYSWANENGARAVMKGDDLSVATKAFSEIAHDKRGSRIEGF